MARITFAETRIRRTVEATHERTDTVLKATIESRARDQRELRGQWPWSDLAPPLPFEDIFPSGDRQALRAPDTE